LNRIGANLENITEKTLWGFRLGVRVCAIPVLLLTIFSLTGCVSEDERQADNAVVAYMQGDYDHARLLLEPLAKKPNENFVLNNARLGSTDLAEHRMVDAESAFLRAYEVINSVGVNGGGRSLGAVLIDEKIRIWKGEPFERAMMNFYLGMIYYSKHDYSNARAAFENALFKLRDYGPGADDKDKYVEVESGFALGYLMLGKSWQHLNEPEKAQQMYDRVIKLEPGLAALANMDVNQNSNLLLVVDKGQGPEKIANDDGAVVGFGPTPGRAGPIYTPRVSVDGQWMNMGPIPPPVDLLALAQDRRWQSIDTILAVKSVVGTGLIVGGAYALSQNRRDDAALGLGLIAAGILLKATSQADIRQWEMLPRTVFIIPLHLTPGPHQVTVNFPSGSSQTWENLVAADEGGENTFYMRMTPYATGPFMLQPVGAAPSHP
jgi:tetratricopeptide (TPR) repeat protein